MGMIRINISALTLLCGYFGKRLVARGGGGIMPVSSNGAYCMLPNQATYAATKAYVAHLGEIIHFELKGKNLDVTTLFPPLVDTDMISGIQNNDGWDFDKMPIGFGIKAKPQDVANAALAALAALGKGVRVHPPRAGAVLMWIIRRLPDGVRFAFFNYVFKDAIRNPDDRW
jgi:short-subunit dehydrogenase